MGFIYIIENKENNMKYIGQTKRNVKIRWTEHCNNKNRLLNSSIKEFGKDKFFFSSILEYPNDQLDKKEEELIIKYNTVYPNGYNSLSFDSFKNKNIGGSSVEGHIKQSNITKERYKENEKLKDLDVPQGISYFIGYKKKYHVEGFKVRKVGVKSKEFISPTSKNNIEYNLERAKKYLEESLNLLVE